MKDDRKKKFRRIAAALVLILVLLLLLLHSCSSDYRNELENLVSIGENDIPGDEGSPGNKEDGEGHSESEETPGEEDTGGLRDSQEKSRDRIPKDGGSRIPSGHGEKSGVLPTQSPESGLEEGRPTPEPGNILNPTLRPGESPGPIPRPGETPSPTPKPGETPSPTLKPGETPSPTPKPEETPCPTPKPEETPGPTLKPGETPRPTPKPEVTPEPTSRPDGYQSVTSAIRIPAATEGASTQFLLLVTNLPPDSLKCRAIEIVISLPEGISVTEVQESRQIMGTQMDWNVSERENMLRIAYLNPNASFAMDYERGSGNGILAEVEIRFERTFEAGEEIVLEYERILARGGDAETLSYELEASAAVITFE